MVTEPEYKMSEWEAQGVKERQALVALLTTGLDDIPSLVRKVSEQAASLDDPDCGGFLDNLWHSVFAAAGQVSSDEQINALVEFLMQLRKTEAKDPKTGEVRVLHGEKLWWDMPTFGWVARDWYNFYANEVEGDELATIERQVKLITLWMARADDSSNDISLYGLWALRETFEDEGPVTSSAVRLAAPWVLNDAKYLWRHTERGSDMHARCGIPGKKYADKEWKGFNKERWAVWRDGFEAAQAELKDEEVKALAGRAAEIMKELEG